MLQILVHLVEFLHHSSQPHFPLSANLCLRLMPCLNSMNCTVFLNLHVWKNEMKLIIFQKFSLSLFINTIVGLKKIKECSVPSKLALLWKNQLFVRVGVEGY